MHNTNNLQTVNATSAWEGSAGGGGGGGGGLKKASSPERTCLLLSQSHQGGAASLPTTVRVSCAILTTLVYKRHQGGEQRPLKPHHAANFLPSVSSDSVSFLNALAFHREENIHLEGPLARAAGVPAGSSNGSLPVREVTHFVGVLRVSRCIGAEES